MERIQEALEKARRERAKSSVDQALVKATSISAGKRQLSNASEVPTLRSQSTVSEKIEYEHTRRVRLDTQWLKSRKLIGGMAHDPLSDPYRQLRGQVLQKMRSNNWKTIAITSPKPNNGKTLTAINLAISLSQEVNQTVLLADFNLRNPSVAQTMGIDDIDYGITDYLESDIPINKILINPEYRRLVILPGTKELSYSSEMLSSPKMHSLNKELQSRYADRIVLYDLPPLLVHDDAISFIPHVDATLLVIEDGGASKQELERAIKILDSLPLVGTVINKAQ